MMVLCFCPETRLGLAPLPRPEAADKEVCITSILWETRNQDDTILTPALYHVLLRASGSTAFLAQNLRLSVSKSTAARCCHSARLSPGINSLAEQAQLCMHVVYRYRCMYI